LNQRPKGAMTDPVGFTLRIERATRNRIVSVATRSGISASVLVELMVEHMDGLAEGVPSWLPARVGDEELLIDD